jgi:hypothetical protein
MSGGDIKNAVLKAAQIAASEPGPDVDKKIHQRHFVQGIEDVTAGKKVMEQSIYDVSGFGDGSHRTSEKSANGFNPMQAIEGLSGGWKQVAEGQEEVAEQVEQIARRLGDVELQANALPGIVERFDDAARERELRREADARRELEDRLQVLGGEVQSAREAERAELNRSLEERLQVLADELKRASEADNSARDRSLEERLQVLASEINGARQVERGEMEKSFEERLQVLGGEIEARGARSSEEVRTHIEGVAQGLREQLKSERESRALALREQGEEASRLLAQAREEWPRQLAAHGQAQNDLLRDTLETGLRTSIEPLRAEAQAIAVRARTAFAFGIGGLVLALLALVVAIVN